MLDEFNALLKNRTWSLVPYNPKMNVVGWLWVYKMKEKSDGSIERYKARLVAKGFNQKEGFDYDETFSPVVKPTTIRTVLSVAVSKGWPIRQLDVRNAFLHGFLSEEVYMQQPPGFVDPSHVCRLHKAIYGLKQAPRAWFHRFSSFLLHLGFHCSRADSSMFIRHSSAGTLVLLLYVDDIIVTCTQSSLITRFIRSLGNQFDMKDLGDLHYFLGMEASRSSTGLRLTQSKYALGLLAQIDLVGAKLCSTPVACGSKLSATDGDLLPDATLYRRIVGSLQYLTLTRPDITYAVNQVCQFMHKPRTAHMVAVKRILRYIKGSLDYGLFFRPAPCTSLSAYSDADWAGCPDSRRSTTGFCLYLGSNLISWGTRKQPTVSRSSAEAEYRALASTTADLRYHSVPSHSVPSGFAPFFVISISLSRCLYISFVTM